jgi:hypothetical protein
MAKFNPSLIRKQWQTLKRKYPEFEDAKPKSDLGPMLDKLVKLYEQEAKARQVITEVWMRVPPLIDQIDRVLADYNRVVPPAMKKEFYTFVESYRTDAADVGGVKKRWTTYADNLPKF